MLQTIPTFLRRAATFLCMSVALAACSGTQWPYKIDVRQGNYVTQEMLAQLKPGMTAEQVRFIMGSPLLIDSFRTDRWDYVYRFTPGKGPIEQRRVALFFADGKLSRVDGDVAPATEPTAAAVPRGPRVIEIEAGKK
ncbi:outer membrane protein assembly factor BamE [Uliginosibacterium sp. H1]|uniref:outer membrane protein assembly factor BamE n=1 Tax=Uliginosibacterium sp. H1 TaxID=3114757 RepID=UPI002E18FFD6|nr:outer membrane protein assembly factor BamE [Uliginosibacterium sp. H1]